MKHFFLIFLILLSACPDNPPLAPIPCGGGDEDEDGIELSCDNCPSLSNPEQSDIDFDGKGDLCDDDKDNDGLTNAEDLCPTILDPRNNDADELEMFAILAPKAKRIQMKMASLIVWTPALRLPTRAISIQTKTASETCVIFAPKPQMPIKTKQMEKVTLVMKYLFLSTNSLSRIYTKLSNQETKVVNR